MFEIETLPGGTDFRADLPACNMVGGSVVGKVR